MRQHTTGFRLSLNTTQSLLDPATTLSKLSKDASRISSLRELSEWVAKLSLLEVQTETFPEFIMKPIIMQATKALKSGLDKLINHMTPDMFEVQRMIVSADIKGLQHHLEKAHDAVDERIHTVDSGGQKTETFTMMTFACKYGQLEVVRLLNREFHADVNLLDGKFFSPLSMATNYNHLSIVKCLREDCAADVTATDGRRRGRTAADYVRSGENQTENHRKMTEYLNADLDDAKDMDWNLAKSGYEHYRGVLDRLEEPLRSAQELTMDSPEVVEFRHQIDAIKKTKDSIEQIVHDDIRRCLEDPTRLEALNTFLTQSAENRSFNATSQIYLGVSHYAFAQDPSWEFHIGEISQRQKNHEVQKPQHSQPHGFLWDWFPATVINQSRLDIVLERLSFRTGGELFILKGCKSMARCFQKMAIKTYPMHHDDDERCLDMIWDVCRGMISYGNLGGIIFAFDLLNSDEFPEVTICNVYNRFKSKPSKDYQDLMVHIKIDHEEEDVERGFPNPSELLCEVQLCLKDFTIARRSLGGHDAYSLYRGAEEVKRKVSNITKRESKINFVETVQD